MENPILVTGNKDVSSLPDLTNKTIIFNGGILVSDTEVTLEGKNTRIVAPPYKIFADNIELEGNWLMDRAYPQWFGAITYKTQNDALLPNSISSEAAINKAIALKRVGEVFLPRGCYLIKSTIKMPAGIQLVGEVGMNLGFETATVNDSGTILTVKFSGDGIGAGSNQGNAARQDVDSPGMNNYVVEINTHYGDIPTTEETETGWNWYHIYPGMGTLIKNIKFYNWTPLVNYGDENNPKTIMQKCILSFGGATFDNVEWSKFGQAVKFGHFYSDSKAIVNCTFNSNKEAPSVKNFTKLYAFDSDWLGDSFVFRHNHIGVTESCYALHLSHCGGGVIDANIINADVKIENSKGITFASNHMEVGARLEIAQSNATVSNNYFWKGEFPSVDIHGSQWSDNSVVTLNGNMYMFYDSIFYNNSSNFRKMQICGYDIAIDENTILNISNEYRTSIGVGFEKMYTCGVLLAYHKKDNQLEYEGIESFNKLSYSLSQRCSISAGFRVDSQLSINYPKSAVYFSCSKTPLSQWVKDITPENGTPVVFGVYSYQLQIYWDKSRGIVYEKDGRHVFDFTENERIKEVTMGKNTDTGEVDTRGLLISFAGFPIKSGAYIRLIRHREQNSLQSNEETMYVDIPLNGASAIYDNGISINGYAWQPADSSNSAVIDACMGICGATFHGENVTCLSTNPNVAGRGWVKGDTIINVGNDTSWTIKTIK